MKKCIVMLISVFAAVASAQDKTAHTIYATPAPPGVIPTGTHLTISTSEPIDTSDAVDNRFYSAVITTPVTDVRGVTVIPSGTPARLVVVRTFRAGIYGYPELDLALQSVSLNRETYDMATGLSAKELNQQQMSPDQSMVEAGNGALLGTFLDATPAGRLGQSPVQVRSPEEGRIHVPAGTRLTFQLEHPIRVEGY